MKVDLWVARKLWQKLVFVVVAKVKTVTLLSGLRYSPRARTAITSHKARSRHGSTIILPCRAVQREGGGGLLPFNVALPPHPSIHAEFVHAPLFSSPLRPSSNIPPDCFCFFSFFLSPFRRVKHPRTQMRLGSLS